MFKLEKALIEAKRHLSHGAFLYWVVSEVCLPVRAAQAYMRVTTWASNKSANVAHLPPSVLYMLSSSSTPESFVAEVLKRTEAGESVGPSVVREVLKAARATEQQGRRAAASGRLAHQDTCKALGETILAKPEIAGAFELFAILIRGLSVKDFERVRSILISESFLSDPRLAEKLERAFSAQAIKAVRDTKSQGVSAMQTKLEAPTIFARPRL